MKFLFIGLILIVLTPYLVQAQTYQQRCEQLEYAIDTEHVTGAAHTRVISELEKIKSHCSIKPVPWKFLAAIVRRSNLHLGNKNYPPAQFSQAEIEILKHEHRKFEKWLYEATGHTVTVTTTYQIVDEPLTSLSLVEKTQAYWARPVDLPKSIRDEIQREGYQSLFVWVKVPDSVPRHGGGVTGHEAPKLWGTLYSCGIVAAKDKIDKRPASPEPIVISHEFYHQITMALVYSLKYPHELFPSNHPPNTILAEGKQLLPANKTRQAWYTRVMRYYITPKMWWDILAWQQKYRL